MITLALLAQLTVALTAPDTVQARTPFTVVVEVGTPATKRAIVRPPDLAPFMVLRRAQLEGVDSVGPAARAAGRQWRRAEHRFTLLAPEGGRFGFSPFLVDVDGVVTRTRALAIVVQEAPAGPASPRVVARAPVDPARAVDVHAMLSADTVWRGQQLSYSVGVFLDELARTRLRRNPEFVPPEVRGAISFPLRRVERANFVRDVGGKRYTAYVFERALFPVTAGTLRIPAARLTYALPQGPGYFSREEPFTIFAESASVVVREPPLAGRPGDWRGAVGSLTATSRVDTTRTRRGASVVVTLRVSGAGNIELLPRPAFTLPWGSVVTGPERVALDSAGPLLRGTKEFDWIVTPADSGSLVIPRVRFPFFDPATAAYRVAETPPMTLTVAADAAADVAIGDAVRVGDAAVVLEAPFEPRGAARPSGRGARVPPEAWGALLGGVLATMALLLWPAARRRAAVPLGARERLRGAPAATDARSAGTLRRAFLDALSQRLGLVDGLADPTTLARQARRAGARPATVDGLVTAMRTLDRVAFGGGTSGEAPPAPATLLALVDALEGETVPPAAASPAPPVPSVPSVPARGVAARVAIAIALATAWGAAPSLEAQPSDDPAIAAYAAGRFADARDAWLDRAERTPVDVDAWVNAGLAAWRIADTATATWAWHRALRLAPADAELRRAMARLPPASVSGEASVLPIPPWWVLGGAYGALLIAAALAWGARRGTGGRARAWALLAASALLAGAAWGLERRLEAPGLAVARVETVARRDPVMTADPVIAVPAGELLTLVASRHGWWRVRVAGARDGWVPAGQLGLLDRTARGR
jgi:hypothetical protein